MKTRVWNAWCAVVNAAASRASPRAVAVAAALIALVVASRAWIAEDAFITYRVLDNLAHGHGLRWNVDERVQVFTHPLWALLHVPLHALLGSLPWSSLLLSALATAGALALAWRSAGLDPLRSLLVLAVPLAASRCFSDYWCSGLENPLVHLLLAAFAYLVLAPRAEPPWFRLALLLALAATTRMDSILLLGPCFAALAVTRFREMAWGRLLAGSVPLVLWAGFSLLYYGFIFPNTAYAKLDVGLERAILVAQGLRYSLDLLRRDPASVLILLLGILAALASARRLAREGPPSANPPALASAALGCGILLYVGYIVVIGGDFMLGRHFSAPVFLALLIVARRAREFDLGRIAAAAALVCLAALAGSLVSWTSPTLIWHGIADERKAFRETNSLLAPLYTAHGFADHPWAQQGRALRAQAAARPPGAERLVVARASVGMLGFYAGPDVVIIDVLGLTDPLLARLPVSADGVFRIGHLVRPLPPGYAYARASGSLDRMAPDLAAYYEQLRQVVAGPLLAAERLRAVARFNAGAYDALRERYLEQEAR